MAVHLPALRFPSLRACFKIRVIKLKGVSNKITYLSRKETRENFADFVDFRNDPTFGLIGGNFVLHPGDEEKAHYMYSVSE